MRKPTYCDCEAGKLIEQSDQVMAALDDWIEKNEPRPSEYTPELLTFMDEAGERGDLARDEASKLRQKAADLAKESPCPKCGGKGKLSEGSG